MVGQQLTKLFHILGLVPVPRKPREGLINCSPPLKDAGQLDSHILPQVSLDPYFMPYAKIYWKTDHRLWCKSKNSKTEKHQGKSLKSWIRPRFLRHSTKSMTHKRKFDTLGCQNLWLWCFKRYRDKNGKKKKKSKMVKNYFRNTRDKERASGA